MFAIFVFTSSLILHPSSLVAGPIANVDYIHKYIASKNGVSVPIKESNPSKAANVKYLLCAIDKANELSVASTNTSYCTHSLATTRVVDTIAVADASTRLFNCNAGGYYKINNKCSNCGAGYYCPAGGNVRNACTGGGSFCPGLNHAANVVLPPTINLAKCTFNVPSVSVAAATACLGTGNTVGHWQLVSSYTASIGDYLVKKVGSVPPGLYRIDSNNRSLGLGSMMVLVNTTLYYGHEDIPNENTSRLGVSIKHAYTVGTPLSSLPVSCNWDGDNFAPNLGCYNVPGRSISLADFDGTMDWVALPKTPGITAANSGTPLGASAIYKWVN